ncbi:MAG: efflux transporter outer membrane subunit [Fluviibacter sp.]
MARVQHLICRLRLGLSVLGLAAGLMLSGCMTGPDFVPPANESLPTTFSRPDLMQPQAALDPNAPDASLQSDIMRWWTVFDDPVLNQVMAVAVEKNWDVLIATQRIEQARAQAVNAQSQLFPQVALNPTIGRQQSGVNNKASGLGMLENLEVPLGVTWETDVFGKIKRSTESQVARVRAAQEYRRNVLVSLTSELASYYSNLRTLQAQIDYTEKAIVASKRRLELTRLLLKRGLDSDLNLAQFEQAYELQLSQLPPLRAQRDWAMYQCAFLAGGFPLDLQKTLEKPAAPLLTRKPLPSALPSQMLRNRPDIRQAEQVLAASTAEIGVAEAAFMPDFSVPLGIGLNTGPWALLFSPGSYIWSWAVNIAQPLFTGGQLQSRLALSNATREQDRLAYEQSVRQAMLDVEKALTGFDNYRSQRGKLQSTVAAQQEVFVNNEVLYKVGIQPEFQYLQSLITLNNNRISLVQAQNNEAVQLISLYKAMGGGWQWEAPSTQSPLDDGMTTPGTFKQIMKDNLSALSTSGVGSKAIAESGSVQ